MRNDKTAIHLKSRKIIHRVIHYYDGRKYVVYNGRKIAVEYMCGMYYQVYD